MARTKVFVSYDYDYDKTLYDFIIQQARRTDSPFDVSDYSLKEAVPEQAWEAKARTAISRADKFMVMLGPNTRSAPGVRKEVAMARGLEKTMFSDHWLQGRFARLGSTQCWHHLQLELGQSKEAARVRSARNRFMEAKLQHLQFIQAVIARMAANSFLFKGWAITIAAALSAFAAADTRVSLIAIALVSTVMFWALDGYYLWLERCFITLHTQVAGTAEADIDFSMTPDKTDALRRWLRTCVRPHLLLFYGALIVVDVIGVVLIKGVTHGA